MPKEPVRASALLGAAHLAAVATAAALVAPLRPIGFVLLVLTGVSFAQYAWDKLAARRAWPRVSERALLLTALMGGWPGAAIAGALFHHKGRKRSYRRAFVRVVWTNALLTYGALGLWLAGFR